MRKHLQQFLSTTFAAPIARRSCSAQVLFRKGKEILLKLTCPTGVGSSAITLPSDIYFSQQWSVENLGTGGTEEGSRHTRSKGMG